MRAIRIAALLWAALAGAAPAGDLPAPSGVVILTISGAITLTNGPGVARFDRAMLERLPQHGFTTATIWTDGAHSYRGVLLRDLLAAVGARGGTIRATALNDYRITIPASEVGHDAPLVAHRSDGQPMAVRDKGPLWIIYPFDDNPAYRTEQSYSRSVWHLDALEITD